VGFNKRQVDYVGRYPVMYLVKFLPLILSSIVLGFLIVFYSNILYNQVSQTDSWLPLILAFRIDNHLIWVFSSVAVSLLSYFVLVPASERFHNSHTLPSEISQLLERAKLRMNINFKVDLRINNEDGFVFTSRRNLFYASIVMSRDAQNAILQEQEMGEAIIANELSKLQDTKPWRLIVTLASFHAHAASMLIPEPYLSDLSDIYGLGPALFVMGLPTLFYFLAFSFLMTGDSLIHRIRENVSKAYQISPNLAQQVLFEGYTITRSDLEKSTKFQGSYGELLDEDNFERILAILVIGGLLILTCLWFLFSIFGSFFAIEPVLNIVIYIFASIIAVVILCLGVARKYNILDDSRPRPYYQLESSDIKYD